MTTVVPSPCVSLCRMDTARQTCVGCWRTIDEIASWGQLADIDKQAVWQRIELRKAAAPPRPHP